MRARLRKFAGDLADTFWVLPAAMVVAAIFLAVGLIALDRSGAVPHWLIDSPWLYNGGGTGARTLLGSVAASTIGVAGTVFSITIAALSLAAGQMGPRLLRNFTRDRGNQLTLGTFLGTFAYALMVLRSVRAKGEGDFVPHLSLSVSILLAFICVGTLVFFVGHMAGRINVETVIDLVSREMRATMRTLTSDARRDPAPPPAFWRDAVPVRSERSGYLQELDVDGLADWAAAHGSALRLLVRNGNYVFLGATIAVVVPAAEGAERAIRGATALGPIQTASDNPEFAVGQLVEVAVRALSPGINDPNTARAVLDRLAACLCELVPEQLPSGVVMRDGRPVLVVPAFGYDDLTGAMFDLIRQNATGSAAVLGRMLDVLTAVVGCEREPARVSVLHRHARLTLQAAEHSIENPDDLGAVRRSFAGFETVRQHGALAAFDLR